MARVQLSSVQDSLARLLSDGTMTGADEIQLLEQFLIHGDECAFEMILRRHAPMVLAVCRRILSDPNDVDDAFQATFLVLLKNGRSIRNHGVLGTWLHGVARRVAVRSQVNSRRRQVRECFGSEMIAREDRRSLDDDAAELRAMLDEEVTRLPERFRSALVLCDLEGRTHEQAAAQLRCPVGTVKSRLARARDRLRCRLIRRGVRSSAAVFTSALAPEPAKAVTTELLAKTLGAAARVLANREVAAGAVSVAIATLVDGTVRSMSMSVLKFATLIITAAGVIATGAGVFAYQAPEEELPDTAKLVPTKAEAETKANANIAKEIRPGTPPADATAKPGTMPANSIAKPSSNQNSSIDALAQARYSAALKSLEIVHGIYKSHPDSFSRQPVQTWALRALASQLDMSNTRTNQIDAFEKYLKIWKDAEKAVKPEDSNEPAIVEYLRLEAELWLAQARAGKEPNISGAGRGNRPGTLQIVRPGTDPKSQALLARLEESIPMRFPNPTPLEDAQVHPVGHRECEWGGDSDLHRPQGTRRHQRREAAHV
jgi:RNA polymerase sigma factor (sigma-70 family)